MAKSGSQTTTSPTNPGSVRPIKSTQPSPFAPPGGMVPASGGKPVKR